MSFINKILGAFLGNKSDRDMKELAPILANIKEAYTSIQTLSNDELRAKTEEFKTRINDYIAADIQKVADLKKRLEIFNSDKNNIVISIHQNKFSQSKYYGTQIFYSPNNSQSQNLAECIRNSVKKCLQPDNERQCKKADGSIYLLKKAENPSVIVECGFISNPDELAKLQSDEYQKEMATAIITGFLDYTHQ